MSRNKKKRQFFLIVNIFRTKCHDLEEVAGASMQQDEP